MCNTMPSSYFFKIKLPFAELNPIMLLDRLCHLPGCIYLKNQDKPVLAVLPQAYCVLNNHGLTQFKRQKSMVRGLSRKFGKNGEFPLNGSLSRGNWNGSR